MAELHLNNIERVCLTIKTVHLLVKLALKISVILLAILCIFSYTYNLNLKSSKDTISENLKSNDKQNIEETKETFKAVTSDGNGILTAGVSEDLITSAFWARKYDNNQIVMNENQILAFNDEIAKKVDAVYRLEDYKSSLSKDELENYINYYKPPLKQMYFSNGNSIPASFYNSIINNTNIDEIKDNNKVSYGLCVKKASIRDFPTDTGIYSSKNSLFDRIQETGCEPCEPVIILHISKDNKWYFVQIYNYRGWIKADSIAVSSDKDTVFDYINNKDFLMVTGKSVKVNINNLSREFALGTKLFLIKPNKKNNNEYEVKIPQRDSNGKLNFEIGRVNRSDDICIGYLPYTKYNIATEAFKFLGTPYDWGDKNSGRDCSSFIMYVYRTFGFKLPRNTGEQEACADNILRFNPDDDLQKRSNMLDNLELGDALYMNGHTMIYLGKYNGSHYVIHDFFGKSKDGSVINQVAVTSVNFLTSNGVPLLQQISSGVKFYK